MRKMLAMLMAYAWFLTAWAGILPEFNPKSANKKHTLESCDQRLGMQTEPSGTTQSIDSVALGWVEKSNFGPREQEIARQYLQMSSKSGGQFYNAVDRPLLKVLDELLQTQLVDGADIVFLIDHTSSMEDDIDEIRQELKQLTARFTEHVGVRAGIVTFSDVKSGSRFGYCTHGLSEKYDGLDKFLQGIELLGSIEDVYGAIYKTVDEFVWKSKTKRLIVIISDEKPATGADTNYSEDEVLAKCAQHGVETNLYPVLVDKYLSVK